MSGLICRLKLHSHDRNERFGIARENKQYGDCIADISHRLNKNANYELSSSHTGGYKKIQNSDPTEVEYLHEFIATSINCL